MFPSFSFVRLALAAFVLSVLFSGLSAAPTAPANLSATHIKATSLTLKWGASVGATGGISGYEVMRDGVLVGSAAGRSMIVSGLAPLTSYRFTVIARDGAGNRSPASDPLSIATLADAYRPTRPTELAAANITTTSFTLSWTASHDDVGITGYAVYRSGVLVGSTASTSLEADGLAPDKKHRMTVRAVDLAGNLSAASAALTVRTLALPPSTPADVIAANIKATSFALKWSASSGGTGGIAGYDVYRDGTLLGSTAGRSFAVTGLAPNTAYSLTVASRDTVGHVSAPTAPLAVTTLPDTTRPTAPTMLNAGSVRHDSFTLAWAASSDNVGVTGYDIYKNGAALGTAPTASFDVGGLIAATTYQMKVKARDAAGNVSAFSAPLAVTTAALPNLPPVVALTSPAADALFTAPITLTLSAMAADPDGFVTSLEFFDHGISLGAVASPAVPPDIFELPVVFATPGPHLLSARATDNRNASTDSAPVAIRLLPGLPYTADFESAEGYGLGPLDDQRGWLVTAGTANVVAGDAAHGEQSAVLGAGATATVAAQQFGAAAGDPSIVFVDLYAKPVAGENLADSTSFEFGSARVALVLSAAGTGGESPIGRFNALDGDDTEIDAWRSIPDPIPLGAGHEALDWQRLTVRLDFAAKTWDLYLNGHLVAADLRFADGDANRLTGLLFQGHRTTDGHFDDLYAGFDNPVFLDGDRDGMDDVWETTHGLDSSTDDRNADPDNDGLVNIQEFLAGTNPAAADTDRDGLGDRDELLLGVNPLASDSDGDGLPDGWEHTHGLDPRSDSDASTDADGDGLTSLDEFQAGSDPNDYFNGGLPVITVMVGGNGHPGPNGLLQVQLTSDAGEPLGNAPVLFSIAAGSSLLAASIDTGAPAATTRNVRSSPDGLAEVYYRTPSGQSAAGTVVVEAGLASAQIALQGASTGGTNQAPSIAITAPLDGALLQNVAGVVLAADAYDPDGSVARVEFFVDGAKVGEQTTFPYRFVWANAANGVHLVTAVATDAAGAATTTVPVTVTLSPLTYVLHDFEAGEDYVLGALDGQHAWETFGTDTALVTSDDAQSGQASVVIVPPGANNGQNAARLDLPDPANDESVRFIDFWFKPVAHSTPDLASFFVLADSPLIAFVRDGETAELQAYESNEGAETRWLSGIRLPVAGDGTVAEWHRITIRQQFDQQRLDVYLDGEPALVDVPFAAYDSDYSLYLSGHSTVPTRIDNLRISAENPLFADADRDGMDDGWEVEHGLNPALNDHYLDNDHDGVRNMEEFKEDTEPTDPDDLDGDGLSDAWERENLGPGGGDPNADSDGDGMVNYQEYSNGTHPRHADTDGDGLEDGQESALGSNPNEVTVNPVGGLTWLARSSSTQTTAALVYPAPGFFGFNYAAFPFTNTYRELHIHRFQSGGPEGNGSFNYTAKVVDSTGGFDGSPLCSVETDDPLFEGDPFYAPARIAWYWNLFGGLVMQYRSQAEIHGTGDPKWTDTSASWHGEGTVLIDNVEYSVSGGYDITLGDQLPLVVQQPERTTTTRNGWTSGPVMANGTHDANGNSFSETTDYQLIVPQDMTGTVRWLEVFTPAADADHKQFTYREWQIDGIKSPVFTLSLPADGTGEVVPFTVELAVDANRDGQIKFASEDASDATGSERPLVFWTNQNRDGVSPIPNESDVLEDLDPAGGVSDSQQSRIPVSRDLQDWNRLWIRTAGLQQLLSHGDLKLALVWNNVVAGTPAINLVPAFESDGGQQYLNDAQIARDQASNYHAMKVGPAAARSGAFLFPENPYLTFSSENTHLLFEGAETGKGQLQWVLLSKNAETAIAGGPGVWMELNDIKQLYERWTVGDGPEGSGGGAPANLAEISRERLPGGVASMQYTATTPGLSVAGDANEDKYILFVHGWNMHPWEKDAFAETALKRLYWQGYKGKFGAFQWPTTYHDSDFAAIFDYDDGEYSAWRSARPLCDLLQRLYHRYQSPSSGEASSDVFVLAHSMGNVVAGEALRLVAQAGSGRAVNTYVATQAAVPAHCYDASLTGNDLLSFGLGGIFGPETPNIYGDWLLDTSNAAGARANFHNVNDFALGIWETDQRFKPDTRAYTYFYGSDDISFVQDLFKRGLTPGGINPVPLHLGDAGDVRDRYEIMAYASEPRSKALGAIPSVTGLSPQNLQSLWPPDDAAPDSQSKNQYASHRWHSAQFSFNNAAQRTYWHTFLNQIGLLSQ